MSRARHSPFSNPSVALPTSQFILQPFRCFTYVPAHSPTLLLLLLRHKLCSYSNLFPSLHLRYSSFSNPSVASPTSVHSPHYPTLPLRHLRQSSISNHSVPSPTSQLVLQPFCRFTYVTCTSSTSHALHLRHMHFTYVTWRAANEF